MQVVRPRVHLQLALAHTISLDRYMIGILLHACLLACLACTVGGCPHPFKQRSTVWCCMFALQGDLGLNIREAHVFNTTDGFALDVFVVDGWNAEVRGGPTVRVPRWESGALAWRPTPPQAQPQQ